MKHSGIVEAFLFGMAVLTTYGGGAALAAEPVDFSKHILGLDGKDLPGPGGKDAPPLDLATVCETALLVELPADPQHPQQGRDAADKLLRFKLSMRIHAGSPVTLTAEEVTMLKVSLAATYGPLVVGRAVEILDPAALK